MLGKSADEWCSQCDHFELFFNIWYGSGSITDVENTRLTLHPSLSCICSLQSNLMEEVPENGAPVKSPRDRQALYTTVVLVLPKVHNLLKRDTWMVQVPNKNVSSLDWLDEYMTSAVSSIVKKLEGSTAQSGRIDGTFIGTSAEDVSERRVVYKYLRVSSTMKPQIQRLASILTRHPHLSRRLNIFE